MDTGGKRDALRELRQWWRRDAQEQGHYDDTFSEQLDGFTREAADAEKIKIEPGFWEGLGNDLVGGVDQVRLAFNAAGTPDAEDIAAISRRQAENAGSLTTEDLQADMAGGKGLFDAARMNPAGMTSALVHGGVGSVPASLATAGTGVATGLGTTALSVNPAVGLAAGMTAAGTVSQQLEKSSRWLDKIREAGAPTTDADALAKWLEENRQLSDNLKDDASVEAIPTAVFDGISAGLPAAGLGARAAERAGAAGVGKVGAKIIEGTVEQGMQGALGAAGSVGSDIAAGKDPDALGALQEFAGEVINPLELIGPAGKLGRRAFGGTEAKPTSAKAETVKSGKAETGTRESSPSPVERPNQGSPAANQGSQTREAAPVSTDDDLLGEGELDARVIAKMEADRRRQKVDAMRALPLGEKLARFREGLDRRGDEVRASEREGDGALSVVEAELRRLQDANAGTRRDSDMADIARRMQVVFGENEDPDFASALALDFYGADAGSSTRAIGEALATVEAARKRAGKLDTPLREVRLAREARDAETARVKAEGDRAETARLTAEHEAEMRRLDEARVTPAGEPDFQKFSDDELSGFAHGDDATPYLATIAEAQRRQDADPDFADKPRGSLFNEWRAEAARVFDKRMQEAEREPEVTLNDWLSKADIQIPNLSTHQGTLDALRESFRGDRVRPGLFKNVTSAEEGDRMLSRVIRKMQGEGDHSLEFDQVPEILDLLKRAAEGERVPVRATREGSVQFSRSNAAGGSPVDSGPKFAERWDELPADDETRRISEKIRAEENRRRAKTGERPARVEFVRYAPGGHRNLSVTAFLQGLADAFDKRLQFGTVEIDGARQADAWIDPANPNTIWLSPLANRPFTTLVGHELIETMRVQQPELFARMMERITPLVKDWAAVETHMREERGYTDSDSAGLRKEFVADFVGDSLGRKSFWQKLARLDATLFADLAGYARDFIDSTLARLRARGFDTFQYTRRHFNDLKAARNVIAEALAEYARGDMPERVLPGADDAELSYAKAKKPAAPMSTEQLTIARNEALDALRKTEDEVKEAGKALSVLKRAGAQATPGKVAMAEERVAKANAALPVAQKTLNKVWKALDAALREANAEPKPAAAKPVPARPAPVPVETAKPAAPVVSDALPLAESERDVATRRLAETQQELAKLQAMGKKIGGESYKNAPVYKQALAARDAAFEAVTELAKGAKAPSAKADPLSEKSAEREKLFRELNEGQPSPEEQTTKQARLAELNREIKAAEKNSRGAETPTNWSAENFNADAWAMRLATDDMRTIPGRAAFDALGENRIGELEHALRGLRDEANAGRVDTIVTNLRQILRDRNTRGAPAQVSSPAKAEVREAREAAEFVLEAREKSAPAESDEERLRKRMDRTAATKDAGGDWQRDLGNAPREVNVDEEDFVPTDAFATVDDAGQVEAVEPSAEDAEELRKLDSITEAATPKARAQDSEAGREIPAQQEREKAREEADRAGAGAPPTRKPRDGSGEYPDRGDAGPVRRVGAQTTDTKESNGFFGPLMEFAKGFTGVVPEVPRDAMHLKGLVNGYKTLIRGQEVSVHEATEEVRKILAPILALKNPVDAATRKATFEARRKENAQLAKLDAATKAGDAKGMAEHAKLAKEWGAKVDALLEESKEQPLVIFENFILWRDLMHRAATLTRDDGSPVSLPFGVNPEEARRQAQVWAERVKASPDSAAIREAIKLHEQSVLATWDDFKKRTLPVDGVWNGGRAYYPHIMPETASGRPDRVRRSATADFRAYLTNPVGSTRAIETDYAKAMFLHLAAVRADNLHQDVVRRDFATLDQTEQLEEERKALRAAGTKDVPDIEAMARARGLVPFDAGDAMRYAMVPTVNRYALSKALGRVLDDGPLAPQLEALQKQGINIPASAFREALAVSEKKPWWVVPEAAAALRGIEEQEQPGKNEQLKRAAEFVNRYWKKYTLFFPHNYVRYEFNNTVADTGKLAAVDPAAFKGLGKAFKEVRAFFRGDPVSEDTKAAFRLGVFDTPTVKEVEDLASIPEFSEKLQTDGERLMKNIVGWAGRDWNKISKYREAMYRLAKFNADLERLRKGETPVYGGAYWKDIETIQDSEKGAGDRNERRAAAISLATLNDAAAVSRSGSQLRRYLIPFYSFTENNLRYHLNLFRNLRDMTASGEMTRGEAAKLGAKSVASLTGRAAVGVATRAVFPLLALALYNAAVGGEDELSEEDRRRLHLNLGKDEQGRRRVLYLENDLAQVMRWFGGNRAMGNVIDVMAGRQSLETAAKDWATNLLPDIANTALGVGPLVRAAVIGGTGREIGMDVTSPRTVHGKDKVWALVKEAVGMVPADVLRNAFDKDYVSGRDAGDWLQQTVLQVRKRDPESWAYYKIRDDAESFLEERKGVSTDRGARSSPDQIALRSFRRAIFKGNIDDALGLYDRLLKYGYTAQRLQASLRSMDPLSSLSKEDGTRRAFVEQLDEQGRKDLDRARLYAERYQVLQGRERLLFPKELKGNPAGQARLREYFENDPRKREMLQSLLEEQAHEDEDKRKLDAAMAARKSMKGAR